MLFSNTFSQLVLIYIVWAYVSITNFENVTPCIAFAGTDEKSRPQRRHHPYSDIPDSVNPSSATLLGNIDADDVSEEDEPGMSRATFVALAVASVLLVGLAVLIIASII